VERFAALSHNKGLYGAESKDPGNACWQMLLGVFRLQTTTEDKKSQASTVAKRNKQYSLLCDSPLETNLSLSGRDESGGNHFSSQIK
jgi:hypothetical protein